MKINSTQLLGAYEQARTFTEIDAEVAAEFVSIEQIFEEKKLKPDACVMVYGVYNAGKSTLINAIDPALDLFTLEVSEASGKGVHTTTYADMHEMHLGGHAASYVIDTPGMRELQLWETDAVAETFGDVSELASSCRFRDCRHLDDAGCAVNPLFSPSRRESYRILATGP